MTPIGSSRRKVTRCAPETRKDFIVDTPMKAPALTRYWRKTIGIRCPHSGEVHLEAWEESVGAQWGGGRRSRGFLAVGFC